MLQGKGSQGGVRVPVAVHKGYPIAEGGAILRGYDAVIP